MSNYGVLVEELVKVKNDMPHAWGYTMDAMQTFLIVCSLGIAIKFVNELKLAISGKTRLNIDYVAEPELLRFITPEIIARSLINTVHWAEEKKRGLP